MRFASPVFLVLLCLFVYTGTLEGQVKFVFSSTRVTLSRPSNQKDCTEQVNKILLVAKERGIDTVVFHRGHYRISAPLVVPAGMCIQGVGRKEVYIEQFVWGHPVFDIHFADGVTIREFSLVSHQPRIYPNGFVSRGTDGFVNNSGIYTNSSQGRFQGLTIEGFTCGLHLSAWDGAGLYEAKRSNIVDDVYVDQVDFGILATGQHGLVISRVSGSFVQQSGSGAAPHLVYMSAADDPAYAWSSDVTIRDCRAVDSKGGHAFQIGSVRGGRMSSLRTDACTGILAIRRCMNVRFDTLVALQDDPNPVGSIFIQPDQVDRNTFNHVVIECLNPSARVLRLDGNGCTYSDIEVRSNVSRVSDHTLITLEGSDSVLRDVRIISPSDTVGGIGVRIQGKRLMLDGMECNSCMAGFTVTEDSEDCNVTFDPARIRAPKGYDDHKPYFDYSRNLKVSIKGGNTNE